jgi:hypothetical protein
MKGGTYPKCLHSHHTNSCSKPDGASCNKCEHRHHKSLHNDGYGGKNKEPPVTEQYDTKTYINNTHFQGSSKIPGFLPVQKIKIKDVDGNSQEYIAMIDSGSNTSFISKNAAKNRGLKGCQTHLTMNLAGGKQKAEMSELINITVMSPCDETIEKHMSVYTLTNLCSHAKTISKHVVNLNLKRCCKHRFADRHRFPRHLF